MPKSGTWYCHYFFHILSNLRRGNAQIPARPREGVLSLPELGLSQFLICHAECPAFDHCDKGLQGNWSQLQYHTDGYNWAAPLFQLHPTLNPAINPSAKLAYLVRNPLDQAVSFFDHSLKHKDRTVMAKRLPNGQLKADASGNTWQPESPREFFFSHNWESYLKQYLSWKHSAAKYPQQILVVSYAKLVRNPEQVFGEILDFFEIDRNATAFGEHFSTTLQLSSKDNLQKLESQMGQALGRDQTDPNSRHIRDGKVAKWRRHFDENDFERMTELFGSWGVETNEFVFE